MPDDGDLERFVSAQEPHYERALAELAAGTKRTHWMWFMFPQLRGLGHSVMAQTYGIASLDEARAFLAHPLLAERLRQCTEAVVSHRHRTLSQIFGSPDDVKFVSSMTLFATAAGEDAELFREALTRYAEGTLDARTIALLRERGDL
jgi:uncharacterized protein (DUF1810 family)